MHQVPKSLRVPQGMVFAYMYSDSEVYLFASQGEVIKSSNRLIDIVVLQPGEFMIAEGTFSYMGVGTFPVTSKAWRIYGNKNGKCVVIGTLKRNKLTQKRRQHLCKKAARNGYHLRLHGDTTEPCFSGKLDELRDKFERVQGLTSSWETTEALQDINYSRQVVIDSFYRLQQFSPDDIARLERVSAIAIATNSLESTQAFVQAVEELEHNPPSV